MTLVQHSTAFGDQAFKRHLVPFNSFAQHSSTASQCSKKKSSHLLKSAKPGLKIERSEILERCAAAFESRVAALEPMSP